MAQLVGVVKRHQGVVVETVEEASHVIYPPPPPAAEEEYVRPLQLRGKGGVLVHWWYLPDRWALIRAVTWCVTCILAAELLCRFQSSL